MATTSLWPIRNSGRRAVKAIVRQVVNYAENEQKTVKPSEEQNEKLSNRDPRETVQSVMSYVSDKNEGMKFVTGINCTAERAVEEMLITRQRWPERGNRVLYHGYQSFLPGESNPEQVHRIGVEMARELWGDRFEVVVATHLDRAHLHNHFVIHAVSFIDGHKFIWDEEFPRMQAKSDEICLREGLNIVPPDEDREERPQRKGAFRAQARGCPTVESIVKEDIDSCISQAASMQDWLQLMEAKGYKILNSGKYVRVFPYGHSKCIRIDRRFGESYSLEGIEAQILNRGMEAEPIPKDEKESVQTLYEEFRDDEVKRRTRHAGSGYRGKFYRRDPVIVTTGRLLFPVGIQLVYLRFIVRTGYRKTPKQVARIHYLFREELTRLDRYIEESKFLIHENIQTEDELKERMSEEEIKIRDVSREKRRIQRIILEHPEQAADMRQNLSFLREELRISRKDLNHCKNILSRMEVMRRKEEMLRNLADKPTTAESKGYHREKTEERQYEESL